MKKVTKRTLESKGVEVIHSMKNQLTGKVYGYICFVPFELLDFADYQRGAINSHIDKIGACFEIEIATDLMVSYRPTKAGEFWCYDGRQHMMAMIKLGYSGHFAKVYTNLTYKDEARRFHLSQDNNRKMNGWIHFKSAHTGGSADHAAMLKKARKHKLTTPIDAGVEAAADSDLKNVSMLLEPLKRGGINLVDLHCKVLNKCFRDAENKVEDRACGIGFTRGLSAFLLKYCMGSEHPLPFSTIKMVLKAKTAAGLTLAAHSTKSEGRPDSRQFYDALCKMFGVGNDQLSLTAHLKSAA